MAQKKKTPPKPKTCFEQAEALLEELVALRKAPRRSSKDRSQHDAWRLTIGKKISVMIRYARTLANAHNWEFGDDDVPDFVLPSKWKKWSIGPIARLYVDLAVCAERLRRVRFKVGANVSVGVISGTQEQPAVPGATGQGAIDPLDYGYAGFNRYRTAQAKTLEKCLKALRELVACLQLAEEKRIKARVARLAPDSKLRKSARENLKSMRAGRMNLKRYSGTTPSGYGQQLLKEWIRPRNKITSHIDG